MRLESKMKFWIKNNYNVLFLGKHGVGKTSAILEAFDEAGLNWKYFSASTMDPWVDFIGVPREKKTEDGKTYLDLVRPKAFEDDEIEALFFDEYNRSHKKVRNAVMELIQFKSINGRKFNNLKIVWAAVNPDEDEELEYDVEKVDPAQKDRFQISVEIPYKPKLSYFKKKFGEKLSNAAIAWWKELPKEIKNEVSPRRLDYALDVYTKKGDLRDVLPKSSNVKKLLMCLKEGPVKEKLDALVSENNTEESTIFIREPNNYDSAYKYLINVEKYLRHFLPLLEKERISALLSKERKILKYVTENIHKEETFAEIIKDIARANVNKDLVKKIDRAIPEEKKKIVAKSFWNYNLESAEESSLRNRNQKKKAFQALKSSMPESLPLEEAIRVANILEKLAASSRWTIRAFTGISSLISKVLQIIKKEDKDVKDLETLVEKYGWSSIADKFNPNENFEFRMKARRGYYAVPRRRRAAWKKTTSRKRVKKSVKKKVRKKAKKAVAK